ncbi:uncharacterized protein LOC112892013 isoform X2 [Panicum hallii]|uniref:uncharacterized protein LOC112892013 isoform X2 n=1 Tax=Panicum hallii TaxID=206008 RepID=UPI000DF4E557|nr:uncharacterized protein LOC112892013 isoform X2 [Panicum hallii]
MLDLLNDAFPEGSALPRNFYEAKKLVKFIGLGYTSIHNIEATSQHGSNSRHQESPRSEELINEGHDVQCRDDISNDQHYDHSEDEGNFLDHRRVAAPLVPAVEITTTPRNDVAPRFANDALVRKEVILYAMLRSDQPVAKGTVISTNPSTEVGGTSRRC